MIITKTPFRISFSGGGSDLPSFYEKYGGCVLSASINKYMYISIHPYFDAKYTSLKYSENEIVDDISKIKHKILNSVLNQKNISGVEISSTADVPAGTGLGSSSSFTVGLLHALSCYEGKYISKAQLAEEACDIEINKLGAPIGKQDQYAAAYGGLNFIRFSRTGSVSVEPIVMKPETYMKLQSNLMMFYTGTSRSANTILTEQKKNMSQEDKTNNLIQMCGLAEEMKTALEDNDLSSFGQIMNRGWTLKKTLASGISNPDIDRAYDIAMENGALGGKLLGAGGGGFLLFYCEQHNQEKLRTAIGLKKMNMKFEYNGSSVVHIGDEYWG
ncbi:GHMP kinase [Paenibacillus paeoniae]|uniref:GHMP kinase n=1 Tax=Paenibacillus paeoniae TaxID=2292705 RepID=A0A371P0V9_9BACL|nr:GHMP kinase [Paenibacillus paeoniae]REK69582.1 GHMP kinase [Paenibacillus paeoniae]